MRGCSFFLLSHFFFVAAVILCCAKKTKLSCLHETGFSLRVPSKMYAIQLRRTFLIPSQYIPFNRLIMLLLLLLLLRRHKVKVKIDKSST